MLVAFTAFLPENRGLARFNDRAEAFLPTRTVIIKTRGEKIPELVDRYGGYGWTGNDLYCNYTSSGKGSALQIARFVPWPEPSPPRLCLLGPQEYTLSDFEEGLYSAMGTIRITAALKYENLIWNYLDRQRWSPATIFQTGQVDRQIRLSAADLAIDIVCTGKTIWEEQLSIYDTIFDQAGLVLLAKDI